MAIYPEQIRGEIYAGLHGTEEDLLVYGGETLAVAGERHLMHQCHLVRHVIHHVQQGVFLHAYTTIADQHELVLGGLVGRLHIVDLGVHPDVTAADEKSRLDFGISLDELVHQH